MTPVRSLSCLGALALCIGCGSLGCGSDSTRGTADTDDGTPDVTLFPETVDTTEPDAAAPEADGTPSPGELWAPCTSNGDCLSGYCVEGPEGYLCTRTCDTTCPEGFDCKSIPARPDVAFVCVPRLQKLCTPCTDDTQCAGGVCLTSDGAGGCASACAGECPAGFACAPDPDGERTGSFCQPVTGSCTCSAEQDLGERTCTEESADGVCYGVSRCDPASGWGECSAATPAPERCNGLDDDCNGEIDDGLDPGGDCDNTVAGVGSCPGVSRCAGTPGWVCDGPMPETETCNGLDDDCDLATDEDFKDADGRWTLATSCGRCGNDCTTRFVHGVGRCGGTSEAPACVVDRCDDGYVLLGDQCVAPVDTTCQGCASDDDCLGGSCLAFEAGASDVCLMPCATGACPEGLACVAIGGLERCAPTSGSCACTPALSGSQRTCTRENTLGRCLGVETCEVDAWSECSAAVPVTEVCNEADDDCDGQIDEEARWENRGAPCTNGLGICEASGVFICDAADPAGPTICSAHPGAAASESCNGLDDDCDGDTDEGLAPPSCPLDKGVCAGAHAVCAGASGFLACNAGSYGPSYELVELSCDGLDNDCDGATDEVDRDGDGHLALACGGDDCDDGAAAAHPGLAEICGDALDNDCSGAADDKDGDGDGFVDAACGGPDCDDAATAVNPAAQEICGNGRDDDCSGALDDKDLDGDGERDLLCAGGLDCDDSDPSVASGGTEIWDAKDNDCDGLVDEGMIPVGTVVVSEVMIDPAATSDAAGEYIEVTNLGASPVNLASWVVSDQRPGVHDAFTVSTRLLVEPGASAVLCRNGDATANGGVSCAFAYATMDLALPADQIVLSLAGLEIDKVAWDESYPVVAGRSLNLDPVQLTRTGNDVHGNWCATPIAAASHLAGGDYGTPGRANPACSGSPSIGGVDPGDGIRHGGDILVVSGSGFIATTGVSLGGVACRSFEVIDDARLTCTTPAHDPGLVTLKVMKGAASGSLANAFRYTGEAVTVITWVDLQYPKTVTMAAGEPSELVFGQVRAQGVTEPAGPPSGITGQVGYGPLGTDPRTTPGWRWLDADWNKQFYDNDEFMRTLVIPDAGTYSYTYRFSDDGGTSFMYGDFDPGTADGLTTDQLGTATVE